jgi:Zn-dependent protease
MFDLPSWRIGSLFGIPIEVNASWLLIFGLVAATLSFNYYPVAYPDRSVLVDVASGVLTAVLFFLSVVLHEMAHSIVARAGGQRINRITLFVFGGVAQMEEEPDSPAREFLMAVAGPGMSLLLAGASFVAFVVLYVVGVSNVYWAPLEYLAVINVGVAVFNLLPGFPLDGGRVLRALLWRVSGDLLKATRWASNAGRGLGWLMASVGLLGALMGRFNLVWFALLGWFLATMAGKAYRDQVLRSKLATMTVGNEMSAPATVVSGDVSVQDFVDRYFLGGRHSAYPVVDGGDVIGMLDIGALKRVPRERWSVTSLSELARRDLEDLVVTPDTHIDTVASRLGGEGPGALLVVEHGRLVGIITRTDVIRALRRMRAID